MLLAFYPWIKALHLVAAIAFVSGALASALVLSASAGLNGAPAQALISRVRRWDGRVTTPAMAATWAIGLGLGLAGHWFSSPWLLVKLAFVGALSAFHGILSARLRAAEGGANEGRSRWMPVLVVGSAAAIVVLAVAKPI